jgi:5-methylcytosine-specific restriction endonuclease McrA
MTDDSPTHLCVDCGTPLAHAKSKGRWPERCPEHQRSRDLEIHRDNYRARKAAMVEPLHHCMDCDEVLVKAKTKWPLRCKRHAIEHAYLQRRVKSRLTKLAAIRDNPSYPCSNCGAPIAKQASAMGRIASRCALCTAREMAERVRQRRERDPARVRATEARWRKGNQDKVTRKNWFRRSLRRGLLGLEAEDVLPDVVYERDKKTCQICLVLVDMSLRWPHPGSPELDHVVPVSRGGAHTYANVRLTHRICNLRKGAKVS